MKAIIISILLFLTVNAQNIWYVNRDAAGSNNGTSWNNAWKRFENINWASLNPGDTVYVSGGSDSTTYLPSSNNSGSSIFIGRSGSPFYSFASGSPVVIASAYHSGHDGEVYITNINNIQQRIFNFYGVSNVKLYGFNIIDTRTQFTGLIGYIGGGEVGTGDVDSLQFIENCNIIGGGWNYGLYLIGCKITIRDCFISQPPNDNDAPQDLIGVSGGRGGHTIDGSTFLYRGNSAITGEHVDFLQYSNHGQASDPRLTNIISNNLMVDDAVEGVSFNNFFYSYGGLGSGDNDIRFIVYNNIFVGRRVATSQGGIAVGRLNNTYPISLFILNNTIIVKGSGGTGSTPITCWSVDTLVVKNNLVIGDTSMNNLLNVSTINRNNKWIDYNFYSRPNGISGNFATNDPLSRTWAQWRSEGLDLNSTTGDSYDVTFVNKYDTVVTSYYTETGRDVGVDLSAEFPFLKYDILGNERVGNWDMGALEFVGTPPSGINLKSKIFLQGPFSTNSMLTTLNQSSLLPNSQPYNQPPWNYSGNESFSSGPNSTMVDWVLVELRSASNPAQVVARRAAVVKNNGLLLSTNGIEGVNFNNVDPGSYYIAVYHRNHLAIMSAAPVQLSSNSTVYDFTTAMNKAYGQNPMIQLAQGVFGMFAADGNSDGSINIDDRDGVWLVENGNLGYLNGDFNMNSGVTVHDVNQFWNINNGAETQVP